MGCRDNSWDIFVIILVLIWIHFFEYEQADLLGSAFCQTIAKRSDLIVQIGQSAPFGRVLFRALARTLAVCKTLPGERTL